MLTSGLVLLELMSTCKPLAVYRHAVACCQMKIGQMVCNENKCTFVTDRDNIYLRLLAPFKYVN